MQQSFQRLHDARHGRSQRRLELMLEVFPLRRQLLLFVVQLRQVLKLLVADPRPAGHRLFVGLPPCFEDRDQLCPALAVELHGVFVALDLVLHIHQALSGLPEYVFNVRIRAGKVTDSKCGKGAHCFLVVALAHRLNQFLACLEDRFRVRVDDVRGLLHPVDLFRRHFPFIRRGLEIVRPLSAGQHRLNQFLAQLDGLLRRRFQPARDLADAVDHGIIVSVRPDPLKALVHLRDAALRFLAGLADPRQRCLHIHKVRAGLVDVLLHLLEFRGSFGNAVLPHQFQCLLALLHNLGLLLDLLRQDLRFVLKNQLFVSVNLQLGLVQFQLFVEGFNGLLALLHALLKLSNAGDPHLDAYAACHCLTPL